MEELKKGFNEKSIGIAQGVVCGLVIPLVDVSIFKAKTSTSEIDVFL